ncbi:MAG TPA: hypothetical protein VK826_00225 [Bacteroidia bacterium]|nr:hypothetical protein [Bacteroidia bacterium]
MNENWEHVLSEYNNAGELLGIDAGLGGGFLNYLSGLNAVQKAQVVARVAKSLPPSIGSRAEFEKHFKELPEGIKDDLVKGSIRLADFNIRGVKRVTSKTVKLFETSDAKVSGGTSIAQGKLPKGMVLLVSSITMLVGTSADLTEDKIKAIDFGSIKAVPAIANGEFYLKANKKQIIPEGKSNRVFVTDNNQLVNLGFWKLHNPRMIRDEELIEFVVELGTLDGVAANAHIMVELNGTITTP